MKTPPHIQAMLQADFYPHARADIELIQTHISWVILSGSHAYKVKKPVNFGFLDFTTLDKRKYFCEQELRLNKRLAADLYLKVLPVTQKNGNYYLDGDGEIVDYCLKMLRFPQHDLLDQRLTDDRFEPAWMDELARDIADFHSKDEKIADMKHFGDIRFIRSHIEANYAVAEQYAGKTISRTLLESVRHHSDKALNSLDGILKRRQENNHIRACHGDLHLRNITLFHDRPCVFDCIEFNDEYRIIDTINDVAFLVMDCEARQRPDLGYRFLSRYLEHSGDYEGLALLPLYLSYRACVRAKANCLLASDPDLAGEVQQQQLREACHYLELAKSYTEIPRPRLFLVGGLSGSGKSHLALSGIGKIPAVCIRSDATRQRLAESVSSLPLYSTKMSEITYAAMFDAAETTLKAGFSAIMDATFLRLEDRDRARSIAEKAGVECTILWLDMDVSVLKKRIRKRTETGKDISDADLGVLNKQLSEYQRPGEVDVHFLAKSDSWPADIGGLDNIP